MNTAEPMLERRTIEDLPRLRRASVDDEALEVARDIVGDVRREGLSAVRHHAERLGDIEAGDELFVDRDYLERGLEEIDDDTAALLERVHDRIHRFADAQRDSLTELEIDLPSGRAGHTIAPVPAAGCYAPGGRYPLPSSVLMTAVTARVAGVDDVWLAAPAAPPVVRAAAAVAKVDGFLRCGGAQAIAALAEGSGEIPACDVGDRRQKDRLGGRTNRYARRPLRARRAR